MDLFLDKLATKTFHTAAVSCSSDMAWPGGVDRCIFVTGKLRWHGCRAWVHGVVPGLGGLALIVFGYLNL